MFMKSILNKPYKHIIRGGQDYEEKKKKRKWRRYNI